MDNNAYVLTFPAFIGLLGLAAWFLIKRQIDKSDKEALDAQASVNERFMDQGQRIGALISNVHALELALANKVGREELEDLKKEWKEDMRELKNDLIQAFEHRK